MKIFLSYGYRKIFFSSTDGRKLDGWTDMSDYNDQYGLKCYLDQKLMFIYDIKDDPISQAPNPKPKVFLAPPLGVIDKHLIMQ